MILPIKKFIRQLWLTLAAVLLLDATLGMVVGYGYAPSAGTLARYFGYGVSTSAKLKTLIGEGDQEAAPIATAGWNNTIPKREQAANESCAINVTVYGMSFSNRMAMAASKLSPCLSVRLIAGPGAPLNHSYFMYQKYKAEDDAQVVALGILASALPKLNTVAHFNSAFEAPGAHMYPRYSLVDGALNASPLIATSLDEFRTLLFNGPQKLQGYLAANDGFYSPWVFGHSWADYSFTLRMLRRAYGQTQKRKLQAEYYTIAKGYTNKNQQIDVAKALVKQFANDVISQGKIPMVVLINDQGYSRALDNMLADYLRAQAIPFVTSTKSINSDDGASFLVDGHFTAALDEKLAADFLAHINDGAQIHTPTP